jgi:hypothetical protein
VLGFFVVFWTVFRVQFLGHCFLDATCSSGRQGGVLISLIFSRHVVDIICFVEKLTSLSHKPMILVMCTVRVMQQYTSGKFDTRCWSLTVHGRFKPSYTGSMATQLPLIHLGGNLTPMKHLRSKNYQYCLKSCPVAVLAFLYFGCCVSTQSCCLQ